MNEILIPDLWKHTNKRFTVEDIGRFLPRTTNLSPLKFSYVSQYQRCFLSAIDIDQLIPVHIQHLIVSVVTSKDAIRIIERCKKLITLRFYWHYELRTETFNDLKYWLNKNMIDSLYRDKNFFKEIWFGRYQQ